jgi:hypothetical protein
LSGLIYDEGIDELHFPVEDSVWKEQLRNMYNPFVIFNAILYIIPCGKLSKKVLMD